MPVPARAVVIPHDSRCRGRHQDDAHAPVSPRAEARRSIHRRAAARDLVAVRRRDVAEDEEWRAMLNGATTSTGGFSRLDRAGDGLLMVAAFEGDKALDEQRLRDNPLVIGAPAQRQRLGNMVLASTPWK